VTTPRDDTTFFGRKIELAELERRLAPPSGARLVTVVGMGGIGKTRLAIEAAERLAPRWAKKGGVVFARLEETRTLESAVRAVARAANVRVAAESKAEAAAASLGDALATRGPMLLVLDGAEGLGVAARDLATALRARAREAAVLATSREPLGVRGEEKLVLAPLGDDDARALFLDRARLAAGREVDVEAGELASIVERVDRLPLAIELAASRLEVLTPEELLSRLRAHRDVLADPSSGRADRRATMRATLDASWELLSHDERDVLAQASVFAGPFAIDAAEEVLVLPSPGRPSPPELLDVLESLLKKSLLVRDDAPSRGRARLRMFETVRAWAAAKLAATGAEAETRARHARFHVEEAERWAARSYGEEGVCALDALQELFPELRAAFDATERTAPASAARIVLALSDLLLFRGLFELRAELFAAGAAAAERASDPRLLARALVAKARVTAEVAAMPAAEQELLRALDLAERAGDVATIAEATRSLGWIFVATMRHDEAEAALARALAMHREQGSARGEADARAATGILRAFQGNQADALAHLAAALAIHVETGDTIRQEKVLGFAALVGLDPKDVARGLPREVLARAPASSIDLLPSQVADAVAGQKEQHARWRDAIDLYRRGVAQCELGAFEAAVSSFERAIAALSRAGVTRGMASVVAHAAVAIAEAGDLAEADARVAKARKVVASEPAGAVVVDVLAAAVDAVRARGLAGEARADVVGSCKEILSRASKAEGAPPELVVARRALERALAAADQEEAPPPSRVARPALVAGRESRWIVTPAGEKVDLVRYGPVRRLLDRLVEERLARPGQALTAEQLIEAGWPGEKMRHTAGLLRVYSAVRRLRRLGLEPVLVTRDDGYLLDPDAEVAREGLR
jgi:predicted ATPase